MNVEVPPPIEQTVTYPSVPTKYTVTGRRVTGYEYPSDRSSIDGRTCLSYTHYYDTDLMVSDDLIGSHGDDSSTLLNQTYSNNYTGKNVDLIIFESGSNDVNYNAYSDHPEFDNPDNTGNSRAIKINWPNLEDVSNNQVSNGRMWDDHSVQAASQAAGLSGGLAKKANIYTVFITVEDTAVEIIDAIKGWHTSKGNNLLQVFPIQLFFALNGHIFLHIIKLQLNVRILIVLHILICQLQIDRDQVGVVI